jgi:hypothetical protein
MDMAVFEALEEPMDEDEARRVYEAAEAAGLATEPAWVRGPWIVSGYILETCFVPR